MWTENTAFSCFLCASSCLCIGLGFHKEFFFVWSFSYMEDFFPFEEFSGFSILITWAWAWNASTERGYLVHS